MSSKLPTSNPGQFKPGIGSSNRDVFSNCCGPVLRQESAAGSVNGVPVVGSPCNAIKTPRDAISPLSLLVACRSRRTARRLGAERKLKMTTFEPLTINTRYPRLEKQIPIFLPLQEVDLKRTALTLAAAGVQRP